MLAKKTLHFSADGDGIPPKKLGKNGMYEASIARTTMPIGMRAQAVAVRVCSDMTFISCCISDKFMAMEFFSALTSAYFSLTFINSLILASASTRLFSRVGAEVTDPTRVDEDEAAI